MLSLLVRTMLRNEFFPLLRIRKQKVERHKLP